jgi:hypothetical protein
VKNLLRPLCVILLLVCQMAHSAVLPMPAQHTPCPQHSMQQVMPGEASLKHVSCCGTPGCHCLQAPALGTVMPQTVVFAGTALPGSQKAPQPFFTLEEPFFRPPIT